jgi:hypothetical protein
MGSVLVWSLVLVGLLLVAFIAVAAFKKRLIKPDDGASGGFTLSDLRALHKTGKMSDAEFEKAKEAVVSAAKRAAERQAQEKSATRPPLDRPLR